MDWLGAAEEAEVEFWELLGRCQTPPPASSDSGRGT